MMNAETKRYANRMIEMTCQEREVLRSLLARLDYMAGNSCSTDGQKHPELNIGEVKDKLHKMGIRFSICPGLHLTVDKPHWGSCQDVDETNDAYLRRVLWTNEQMAGYHD